jgi:DNA polymerase III subunit delta
MVAIKAHEADRTLQRLNPSWRVILLYGPDNGLVAERAAAISRAAVDDPADPFQLIRMDGDMIAGDPARLSDEANTIGLFGNRRALRISPTSRSLLAAVEPLLASPPVDALVVIEAGELQRSNPLRVACERAGSALAIPCYGDTSRDLGTVIDNAMQAAGKRISRPVRDLLAASLGSDRLVSRQELDKLILYCGDSAEISAEDVSAIVGDSAAREIDTLVDAVFAGQLAILDVTLAKLAGEGVDGNAILASLLRHALGLLRARSAMDDGKSSREAANLMRGLPFPRLAIVETAIRAWSLPRLRETIQILGQASASLRSDSDLGRLLLTRSLWTISRMAVSARAA